MDGMDRTNEQDEQEMVSISRFVNARLVRTRCPAVRLSGCAHPSPSPLPVRGEGILLDRGRNGDLACIEHPLPSRGEGRVRGERGAGRREEEQTIPPGGRSEIEML